MIKVLGHVFKIRSAAVPGRSNIQRDGGFLEFTASWLVPQSGIAVPGDVRIP